MLFTQLIILNYLICWINLCDVDRAVHFGDTHSLGSDLSVG